MGNEIISDIESEGLLSRDGGTFDVNLSGPEMYEAIKDIVDNLPDKVPAKNITVGIPLASSLHEFTNPSCRDAYLDADLTPCGVGLIDDIPHLKDQATMSHVVYLPQIKLIKDGTGYYYLRKLSRSERKNYLKACKIQHSFPINDWLQSRFPNMEEFIESAFIWHNTPQGHEYWARIATVARWTTSVTPLTAQEIYDTFYDASKFTP